MTSGSDIEMSMEDALSVHLLGFASGRTYERQRIIEWLRYLDAQNGEINRFIPTTIANWIEQGMHLS